MLPINVYALTRINDEKKLSRLERQMSARGRFLHIKEWEIESLRIFCAHLCDVAPEAYGMKFFYSFIMPKLGKEYDLLRVGEGSIVNVELKSGIVSREAIQRQLLQNKYYLSALGKTLHFYTFVSQSDQLFRLTNSERLTEASWEELAEVLLQQKECYEGRIEELFREEDYLISPITDPGRFLRGDYFLTSQQRDIRGHILDHVLDENGNVKKSFVATGFTGLPGTGKSILLYDIAMRLSKREMVCVLHIGANEKGLEELDERLKRVDFYYCDSDTLPQITKDYAAILIDDGHRLSQSLYREILDLAIKWQVPLIATFDKEDALPQEEGIVSGGKLILGTEGYIGYRLTNRIRLNSELSSFIASVMRMKGRERRQSYPSVSLSYAGDTVEAERLLAAYVSEGYVYIDDGRLGHFPDAKDASANDAGIAVSEAVCREFDQVCMVLDDTFFYDEDGYLRQKLSDSVRDGVRNLYHGLSRAKKKIAIIVCSNPGVFDGILSILQGE